MSDFLPRFPIYIPSKGRSEYMMTSRHLTEMGIDHFVIVEPQQVAEYEAAASRMNLRAWILELDMTMKERYELCDSHGLTRSTGSGPARQFAWEHSNSLGCERHWVMDDNINGFYRLNKNLKVPCKSPAFFIAMEDFRLRYSNVAMAGPNYFMFASRKTKMPAFVTNTRIYSCNLIRNDIPFKWRGRYNEDTILSLDILKAGWSTVLFNAFLQYKLPTQTMKGGNTDELYHGGGGGAGKYSDTGTVDKSQMLADVHPEVAEVAWKFGRWHHNVNYEPFKKNRLRRNPGWAFSGVNNYGMKLIQTR